MARKTPSHMSKTEKIENGAEIVKNDGNVILTDDGRILVSSKKLIELFDGHVNTASNWSKMGAPKFKRGWWDVKDIIRWRGMTSLGKGDSAEAQKLAADARLKTTRADVEELKYQSLTGELVPKAMVKANLVETFTRVRNSFLALGDRLMNRTYTLYPELAVEAKRMVDREVREALVEIAKGQNYKYATTRKMAGRPRRANATSPSGADAAAATESKRVGGQK